MCYLHQLAKEEPDLNYRNDNVKAEMLKVVEYYLNLGADGFRVNSANLLFEVANLGWSTPKDGYGDMTSRDNVNCEDVTMNLVCKA